MGVLPNATRIMPASRSRITGSRFTAHAFLGVCRRHCAAQYQVWGLALALRPRPLRALSATVEKCFHPYPLFRRSGAGQKPSSAGGGTALIESTALPLPRSARAVLGHYRARTSKLDAPLPGDLRMKEPAPMLNERSSTSPSLSRSGPFDADKITNRIHGWLTSHAPRAYPHGKEKLLNRPLQQPAF